MKTIADLTDEYVVYRDLEPCDARLPGLCTLRSALELAPRLLPRKRERAYAQVLAAIVTAAQQQRGLPAIERFLVIGDTDNDRQLALFLCEQSPHTAYGFIAVDAVTSSPTLNYEGPIAVANRWALIDDWLIRLHEQQPDWSRTAVLIDIDKTLLGPRGRNDGPIDDARAEGALVVAHDLLGGALDEAAFCFNYASLCQKHYHDFTCDNQDYVTYTALLIASGVLSRETFDAALHNGDLPHFAALLEQKTSRVPDALQALHREISARVAEGDPTPFIAFRRAEFVATAARLSDGRLTICREVFTACMRLRTAGALCFAASDKPSESARPTEAQRAQGFMALHHTPAIVR
ncbi:hypothetical protein HC891_01035 [Candidatus Gracilibacteria bacterium]|nr:hypothetical protein [Candidatus Gracilibacteria bacterium]